MATVAYTTRIIHAHRIMVVSWEGLGNGDDGQPLEFIDYSDRSVHVKGTFGAGGTLVIEGSNDAGVSYAGLTDPYDNAVEFQAAKIEGVTELVEKLRPRVTAGDGTTDLDVHMLIKIP